MTSSFSFPLPALLLMSLAVLLSPAQAAETSCDCQQSIAACSASISVKPVATTTLDTYAAELRFISTAPACSKINYEVDGVPYFNLLVSGNSGSDNLWGPKQISRANITSITCQVCKQVANNAVPAEKPDSDELKPASLDGQWYGAGNNSFGSAQRWTLSLVTVAGGKMTVTGTMEGNFPTVPISASGTVKDGALTWIDQQTTCSAKLLTDVSLSFECRGQGSVQLVMKRQ